MNPQAIVIRAIIEECKYGTYLELGVYDGVTINYVSPGLSRVVGVDTTDRWDVKRGAFFKMTTDDFFKQNKETFDVIFIDADHSFAAVRSDFENSVLILNKGGTIFLHDTDPSEAKYLNCGYCGDSYRVVEYVRKQNRYDAVTLPVNHCGLTIVRKSQDLRVLNFLGAK